MKYLGDNQTERLSDLDQVTHISLRRKGFYYHTAKKNIAGLCLVTLWRCMIRFSIVQVRHRIKL